MEKLDELCFPDGKWDVDFLSASFKGADIVYLMEALNSGVFFDHNLDFIASNIQIGKNLGSNNSPVKP